MKGEARSGTDENGNGKAESSFLRLMGKPMIQMVLMCIVTGVGTIAGASYVVGVKIATFENDVSNVRKIAVRAEAKATVNQMAITESYKQLAGLKISIGKRFANMKADMLGGHGEIKAEIARAVTDIGWMKSRIEADSWRTRQWLERNKR